LSDSYAQLKTFEEERNVEEKNIRKRPKIAKPSEVVEEELPAEDSPATKRSKNYGHVKPPEKMAFDFPIRPKSMVDEKETKNVPRNVILEKLTLKRNIPKRAIEFPVTGKGIV